MAGSDLEIIQQLAESGSKLRLSPGVIGKGAMMWLAVAGVWLGAILKASPEHPIFTGALFAGAGLLTIMMAWETQKMRRYAEKNPGPALLEGAELLAYQKFEARAKELPSGDKSVLTAPTGEKNLPKTGAESPQP